MKIILRQDKLEKDANYPKYENFPKTETSLKPNIF